MVLRLWDDLLSPFGYGSSSTLFTPPASPEAWFILQSAQVISRIQAFKCNLPGHLHAQEVTLLQTFDFSRLYTNLPQDDLITRLTGLVREC